LPAVRRSLLTILIVAAISGWIARAERVSTAADPTAWVRTSVGWESRAAVEAAGPPAPPAIHPAVIASMELCASLFFLVAFPARVRLLATCPAASGPRRRRVA
jgi:hypothetical protein